MYQDRKAEKIGSYRDGSIWLTVFETPAGVRLFTLSKSYQTDNGWRYSNFFQLGRGDAASIRKVLDIWEQEHVSGLKNNHAPLNNNTYNQEPKRRFRGIMEA